MNTRLQVCSRKVHISARGSYAYTEALYQLRHKARLLSVYEYCDEPIQYPDRRDFDPRLFVLVPLACSDKVLEYLITSRWCCAPLMSAIGNDSGAMTLLGTAPLPAADSCCAPA